MPGARTGRAERRSATTPRAHARARQRAFLVALEHYPSIARAAALAGINRVTAYRWRDRFPAFREAWEHALERGADALEGALFDRAVRGTERLKFGPDGAALVDPRTGAPYIEREYSDQAAIALLRALRPEKYRERARIEHTAADAITERIFSSRRRGAA